MEPHSTDSRDRLVIFLHSMKTGGATLRKLVHAQYEPGAVCDWRGKAYSLDDLGDLRQLDTARLRAIQGHLPFGVHELLPGPATYVTLLRDPIERTVSLYRYLRTRPAGHGLRDQCAPHLATVEQFVTDGRLLEVDNGQTRRLAGQSPAFGACSEALLERAKANLRERFSVVGLTERYDETLLLLSRSLGWQAVFYHKRRNVTAGKPTGSLLSDRALHLIEEHNRLDIELYRCAQELFAEQVRRQGPQFTADLSLFQAINEQLTNRAAGGRGAASQVGEPRSLVEVPTPLLDAHIHLLRREVQLQKELTRQQEASHRREREIRALRKRLNRAKDRPPLAPASRLLGLGQRVRRAVQPWLGASRQLD